MIRMATLLDVSRLAEILIFAKRTAYRSIFQDDEVSFNKMQVMPLVLEFMGKTRQLDNMAVYDDGIVKGLLRWSEFETEAGAGALELQELYIEPFFQGQGVGAKLLEWLVATEAAGLLSITADSHVKADAPSAPRTIFLWVLERNTKARDFYEKHGFSLRPERELEEGTSEYLCRYELQI